MSRVLHRYCLQNSVPVLLPVPAFSGNRIPVLRDVPECSVSVHLPVFSENSECGGYLLRPVPRPSRYGREAVRHPCNRFPGIWRFLSFFPHRGTVPHTTEGLYLKTDTVLHSNSRVLSHLRYAPEVRPQIRDARSLPQNVL